MAGGRSGRAATVAGLRIWAAPGGPQCGSQAVAGSAQQVRRRDPAGAGRKPECLAPLAREGRGLTLAREGDGRGRAGYLHAVPAFLLADERAGLIPRCRAPGLVGPVGVVVALGAVLGQPARAD